MYIDSTLRYKTRSRQETFLHEKENYVSPAIAPVFANLSDGTPVTIRKARTKDAFPIQEMHNRLSLNSIQYRLNGVIKPSLEDLYRLCDLATNCGSVFVASEVNSKDSVVALTHYEISSREPATAEVGILVEDRFQGQGLGPILLDYLAQHALQNDLNTFIALVHPSNIPVQRMISRSGFQYKSRYNFDFGLKEIRLSLKTEGISEWTDPALFPDRS